jgi:hypothetical protein
MLTQQASLHELLFKCRFKLGELLARLVLLHRLLRAFLGERIFLFGGSSLGLLSASQRQQIVGFVELFEWCGIEGNDAVLHQCLGTDELVVGGVVDDVEDASLASGALRCPREVSTFETKGTEFAVSSTGAHKVDALGSDLKSN